VKRTEEEFEYNAMAVEKSVPMLKVRAHFGLTRDPFGRISGRRDIFRSEKYKESMAQIADWIREGEIFCVIGNIGSGKTTLIGDLMQSAMARRPEYADLELIHVGHPDRENMGVGSTIYPAIQMHFSSTLGTTVCQVPGNAQRRYIWLKQLLGQTLADRSVCLLIEEAHRCPGAYLKALKEFTEIGWATRESMLAIGIIGHPSVEGTLKRFARDVYDRVRVGNKFVRNVSEMHADEVIAYLKHRCGKCGNANVFHPGAARVIARVASTPLGINRMAWAGMGAAWRAGAKQVLVRHVTEGFTVPELVERLNLGVSWLAAQTGVSKGAVSATLNNKYTGDADKVNRLIRGVCDDILHSNGAGLAEGAFVNMKGGQTASERRQRAACAQK
jgi:type II secretory pathway predicted ATPase ExeA